MAFQLLDAFKLVGIPIFHKLVFPNSPKVVRVGFEANLHDGVVMGKDRFVAVAKVEAPDLHILVG